jgi:hypothetical protein
MNDRSAAVRAQGEPIAEAQQLLKAYVESKRAHPDAVIMICSGFSTGRASARHGVWCARPLGDDPGRSPDVAS